MVESQGKVSEKSGNFEMDIEWQPWKSIVQMRHPDESILTSRRNTGDGLTLSQFCGNDSLDVHRPNIASKLFGYYRWRHVSLLHSCSTGVNL